MMIRLTAFLFLSLYIVAGNGEKYNVTTILHEPFTMLADTKASDKKFIGYVPDLLDLLAERIGFQYNLNHVHDSKWGSKTTNGQWNGMIGELLSNKADIAASAMTITSVREKDIDFIQAFMHTGLTAVIKRPGLVPVDSVKSFTVLTPLKWEVFLSIIVAYVIVSLTLWAMNVYNPYEWGGAANAASVSMAQSDYFSASGSFWFAFTITQWQGFDRSPRSVASRILSCFWMAFVTVTLVSYTAAIFSHLNWESLPHSATFSSKISPTIEDIIHDPEMDYGTIAGASTFMYFNKGKGPLFDAFRQYTNRKPEMFVRSNEEGLNRVRKSNGKYAYICESSSALVAVNSKPCDLMMISDQISTRSYGFAVREDSPLKSQLHLAMLELHENGELKALERKWFYDSGKCWDQGTNMLGQPRLNVSNSQQKVTGPAKVTIAMFMHPLIFLVVGLFLAIITAVVEIMYYRYKGRNSTPDTHKLEEDIAAI